MKPTKRIKLNPQERVQDALTMANQMLETMQNDPVLEAEALCVALGVIAEQASIYGSSREVWDELFRRYGWLFRHGWEKSYEATATSFKETS